MPGQTASCLYWKTPAGHDIRFWVSLRLPRPRPLGSDRGRRHPRTDDCTAGPERSTSGLKWNGKGILPFRSFTGRLIRVGREAMLTAVSDVKPRLVGGCWATLTPLSPQAGRPRPNAEDRIRIDFYAWCTVQGLRSPGPALGTGHWALSLAPAGRLRPTAGHGAFHWRWYRR